MSQELATWTVKLRTTLKKRKTTPERSRKNSGEHPEGCTGVFDRPAE